MAKYNDLVENQSRDCILLQGTVSRKSTSMNDVFSGKKHGLFRADHFLFSKTKFIGVSSLLPIIDYINCFLEMNDPNMQSV